MAQEYLILVGEDGSGMGRPPREGESLLDFLREYRRDDGYWGRDADGAGLPESELLSDPEGLTGWPGVEVLEALYWSSEPAVWARVRVPDGTRVLDFGGPSVENRYHAPCVELSSPP